MVITRTVKVYIGVITTLALFFLIVGSVGATSWDWQNLTIWALVCVLSELLWLPTISNQATVSMASTFNLAAIFLLGWERSLWVIAASTLFANLAIQKKEWYKAIFNVGQSVVTAAAAGTVFYQTGGAVLLPEPTGPHAAQIASFLTRFNNVQLIIPFLASGFLYQFVNTFLVSGVIALTTREPLMKTWRRNYGYMTEIVSSVALMFLAPLVVLSYGAISFTGIILFFVPLIFIRDASRRYIELQKAQDTMIRTERLVAQGEMAGEIGHELNNYLAAIGPRAQMMMVLVQPDDDPRLRKCAEIIYENTAKMATLTAGLMNSARAEIEKRPSMLNELINKTVEFVRPQNKYDDIRFSLQLDESIPIGDLDPAQIQQVILNLFSNAADALHATSRTDKLIRIVTRYEPQRSLMVMSVSDNGVGMPPEVTSRIFETLFTTKKGGHGFGLSTSFRIVEKHDGRILVDSQPGEGTVFTIELPLYREAARGNADQAGRETARGNADQIAREASRTDAA